MDTRSEMKGEVSEEEKDDNAKLIQTEEIIAALLLHNELLRDLTIPLRILAAIFLEGLGDRVWGKNSYTYHYHPFMAPSDPHKPFFSTLDRRKMRDNILGGFNQVAADTALVHAYRHYGLEYKQVNLINAVNDEAKFLDLGKFKVGKREYLSFTSATPYKKRYFNLFVNLGALTQFPWMNQFFGKTLAYFEPKTNMTYPHVTDEVFANTTFAQLAEWNVYLYNFLKDQDMEEMVHLDKIAASYTSTKAYLTCGNNLSAIGIVILVALLLRAGVLDRISSTIYRRFYPNNNVLELWKIFDKSYNKKYLTEEKIQENLRRIDHENRRIKPYAKAAQYLTHLFSIIALPFYAYEAVYSDEPPIIMLAIIATIIFDQLYKRGHYFGLERWKSSGIEERKSALDLAVQCTNTQWTFIKTENLRHSYLEYKATRYKNISAGSVCQMVKNELLKNGIDIRSFSSSRITVSMSIKALKKSESDLINRRLLQYLDGLSNIRLLKEQLIKIVPNELDCNDAMSLDKNRLPQLNFYISLLSATCNITALKKMFPDCKIDHQETFVVITGCAPTQVNISDVSPPFSLKPSERKTEPKPPVTSHKGDDKTQKREKKAKNKAVSTPSSTPSDVKMNNATRDSSDSKIHLQWGSAVYNSEDKNSEVKPLESKIFKHHYVVCKLLPEYFPAHMFKSVKDKIESGRLANAKKGDDGLQFREEEIDSKTNSYMRLKLFGSKGKGNIRCYSEREITKDSAGNTAYLHIFKHVDLKSK